MLNREFLTRHALRYPVHIRHGEDFLFIMYAFLVNARFILGHRIGYFYTERSSGWSRTQVNYDGMWQHIQKLLIDPCVADDTRLTRLIEQRVRLLKRMAAERCFDHYRQAHDAFGLFIAIFTDIYVLREAVRRIVRKCLYKVIAL